MGLGPVEGGNGHDASTDNVPQDEEGPQRAGADANGDEDGGASLPADDNAYQEDADDGEDADNDAR